ncbi:hypothetical protein E2320_002988 [Naja naja]|nr:hypothetical protein E2320_002988 [Naja naja]
MAGGSANQAAGERPYKCPHCDYAGTQSGSLKYHLQRHHREQKNAAAAAAAVATMEQCHMPLAPTAVPAFPPTQLTKSHGSFLPLGGVVAARSRQSRRKSLLNGKADFQPLDLSLRPALAGGALHRCQFCPFATSAPELMELHLQVHHSRKTRTRRCSHTAPKAQVMLEEEIVELKDPEFPNPKGEISKTHNFWSSEDQEDSRCLMMPQGKPSSEGAIIASLSSEAALNQQEWEENLSQDSEEPKPEKELSGPLAPKGPHQEASKTGQGLVELQLEPQQQDKHSKIQGLPTKQLITAQELQEEKKKTKLQHNQVLILEGKSCSCSGALVKGQGKHGKEIQFMP